MGYCSRIATKRSWVQLLVKGIHYQINTIQLKAVNLMRFILGKCSSQVFNFYFFKMNSFFLGGRLDSGKQQVALSYLVSGWDPLNSVTLEPLSFFFYDSRFH